MIDVQIKKACVSLETKGATFSDWKIVDFGEHVDMKALPLWEFLNSTDAEVFAENAYRISNFAHNRPEHFTSFLAFKSEVFHLNDSNIFFLEGGFPLLPSKDELEYGFNIDLLTVTLDTPPIVNGVEQDREVLLGMSIVAPNGKCFDFYLSQYTALLDFVNEMEG